MILIILSAVVVVSAGLVIYYYFSSRGTKRRLQEALEQLAATMQINSAEISTLPVMSLTGSYRTFKLIIEASTKKVDRRKQDFWEIATELACAIPEKLYLQSETQEGKLRKVINLDVINTGDEFFDRRIMVFSSNGAFAKKIFNPYMRQRFLWAGYNDFVMEINNRRAFLQLYLESLTNVRYVRHSLEVFTELLNILETV